MARIRIAIAGVGNCCSALLQGVQFYSMGKDLMGLISDSIGGYTVSDIEFVSAFDIDRRKVGKGLSEAIYSEPNKVPKFVDLPNFSVTVSMGPILDSPPAHTGLIKPADVKKEDVAGELRDKRVDVLVNLVSGSAEQASRHYAEAAIDAGCAFLNATPASIASDGSWARRFEGAGLPLIGDDLLDQVGATIVHMGLLEFLHGRGVRVDESYQLDVGGGVESLNTMEKTRELKRKIKTSAVSNVAVMAHKYTASFIVALNCLLSTAWESANRL